MAVKKNSGAKPKKTAAAGSTSGKKFTFFFKFARCTIVYLLAVYGLHAFLQKNVSAYRNFSQKQYKKISATAQSAGEQLTPYPTITIKNRTDLKNTPYDNLALGVPSFECDVILDRKGYALGYAEKYEQPLWVSYKLTADEVKSKKAKRSGDFRSDPDIPTLSAEPDDYKRSFFERGHLAPAADMSFSLQTMSESFYMSNMSPQRPEFNRGIWKTLEENVRHFAAGCGAVYVVAGPVFEKNLPCITIGKNKVAVPDKYYKVILDANAASPQAIGFIIPNSDTKADLSQFAVTVDAVENATGLDFFAALPDSDEAVLESSFDYSAWKKLLPGNKQTQKRKSTSSKRRRSKK